MGPAPHRGLGGGPRRADPRGPTGRGDRDRAGGRERRLPRDRSCGTSTSWATRSCSPVCTRSTATRAWTRRWAGEGGRASGPTSSPTPAPRRCARTSMRCRARRTSWTWRVPEPVLVDATDRVRALGGGAVRSRRTAAPGSRRRGTSTDARRSPGDRVRLVRPRRRVLRRDPGADARGRPGRERDARRGPRRPGAGARGRRRDRADRAAAARRGDRRRSASTSPARCSMCWSARPAARRRSRSRSATRPRCRSATRGSTPPTCGGCCTSCRTGARSSPRRVRVVRPRGRSPVHLGDYGEGPTDRIRERFCGLAGVEPRPIGLDWGAYDELDAEMAGARRRGAGAAGGSWRPRPGPPRRSCDASRPTPSRGPGRSRTGSVTAPPPRRGPGPRPRSEPLDEIPREDFDMRWRAYDLP